MKISRREFVERAAGAAGSFYLWPGGGPNTGNLPRDVEGDCVLLDLGAGCAVRESLLGYEAALGVHATSVREIKSPGHCQLVIVPGAGRTDPGVMRTLSDFLEARSTLLLESGAGFSSAEEFAVHREMLRDGFGIDVEPPVELWGARENEMGQAFARYVEYAWPREVMVRDFSRVVPVVTRRADVIGRVGNIAVAAKKRVGNGLLIFLGSPMGPALRAGDAQARSWIGVLASRISIPKFESQALYP